MKQATFPILDKLGREIKPGDIIAYGHALGRCAGLRIGKVLKVAIKDTSSSWNPAEPPHRITVQGVDDDWSFEEVKLASKKGTLMFPERIIVLDPSQVPQQFLDLLNAVPLL